MNLQNLTPIQQRTLSAYPDFKSFMQDYKPEQLLVAYEEIRSVTKSVSCIRLALSDITTLYDSKIQKAGLKYVTEWLDFVNRFSNINKPLTETNTVAYMIYTRFSHFYFSDLKILFEKLMCGEYGSFYGSVDAQRILTSFAQYNSERSQTIQRIKQGMENFIRQQMDALYSEADRKAYADVKDKEFDYRQIAQIRDNYRKEIDKDAKSRMEEYKQFYIDKLNERMQ